MLCERLVNIPAEVVPPMYKMLVEEITWAVDDKEPYTFSHYLILSKTYEEVESQLDQEEDRPKKKCKKGGGKHRKEVFYFHPEDEVMQRDAIAYGDFSYLNEGHDGQADSKRAFQELGIRPQGHMILIDAQKFNAVVHAIQALLAA